MPFRALLCSKSSDTSAALVAACKRAGIRAEVCPDIFSAIEKAKTQAFSCVIVDWADQPEANFLLRRARESANPGTVGIAIVDRDPPAAEIRDNRLDFLIHRSISGDEVDGVLAKACEKMRPSSVEDLAEPPVEVHQASHEGQTAASASPDTKEHSPQAPTASSPQASPAHADESGEIAAAAEESAAEEHGRRGRSLGVRGVVAAALVLAAAFLLWRSHDAIRYLSRTPEGTWQVLRESVAALFYLNNNATLPAGSAASDARQDAYFNRAPAAPNAQPSALGVVATESTLPEAHIELPKAFDFPLPVPVLEHQEPAPIHKERAAIPESMRNSPPIAPPVVVTVNPAQMMPVSAPSTAQPTTLQLSEPVAVSEQAERALLIHSVDPAYPTEALAQKLHGPVVLQAVIARDGSVEDLKMIRGYFVLAQAAIAAVKQWRFQPYTLNGHAAATQTVITINFSSPPG